MMDSSYLGKVRLHAWEINGVMGIVVSRTRVTFFACNHIHFFANVCYECTNAGFETIHNAALIDA